MIAAHDSVPTHFISPSKDGLQKPVTRAQPQRTEVSFPSASLERHRYWISEAIQAFLT
jgi:hypothetical protein